MSLLGVLFVVFLFFFVVRPLFRGWQLVHRARKQMREQMDELNRRAREQERASRPGGWHAPAKGNGKKYAKTDGEYVEYEEVQTAESEIRVETDAEGERLDATTRVSDAEWEEV